MKNKKDKFYYIRILSLAIVAFFSAGVTYAQGNVAELTAATHPELDKTFWVKLGKGINVRAMDNGMEIPIHGKLFYHEEKEEKAKETMLSVKKTAKNKVEITILWFESGGKYYYPNAKLQAVYIDNQLAGTPSAKNPNQIALNKLSGKSNEPISQATLKADAIKLNPFGQQIIVVEQATLTAIYQMVASVLNLGVEGYKKIAGVPKALPPGTTTLAFTFQSDCRGPHVALTPPDAKCINF